MNFATNSFPKMISKMKEQMSGRNEQSKALKGEGVVSCDGGERGYLLRVWESCGVWPTSN